MVFDIIKHRFIYMHYYFINACFIIKYNNYLNL